MPMIQKPTLLLDKIKCRKNISAMVSKMIKNNVDFRPHFKTHQSLEIGRWFMESGIRKITVSSIEMAEYFSPEWNDITVAFPVNIREIETINKLAVTINLNLLVESSEAINFLKENLKSKAGFFIKIDVGNNRSGIHPSNTGLIDAILSISGFSDRLNFKGFLGHAGHTYKCKTRDEVTGIHNMSREVMAGLKNRYIQKYPDLKISLGDTPGCCIACDFTGIDELRPGNFVFYDLMQCRIGSCMVEQIAVALACPVVAIHKDRGEIVVYGGSVHFSTESLENEKEGTVYGRVAEIKENGWGQIIQGMYLKSLTQEHGIVSVPHSEILKYSIGDYLIILPVHSCITANSMKNYLTFDSEKISRM